MRARVSDRRVSGPVFGVGETVRSPNRGRSQFSSCSNRTRADRFPNAIFSALSRRLQSSDRRPISVFVENLDLSRFGGAAYDESLSSSAGEIRRHADRRDRGGRPRRRWIMRSARARTCGLMSPIVFTMVDEPTLSHACRFRRTSPAASWFCIRRIWSRSRARSRPISSASRSSAIIFSTKRSFRHFPEEIPGATKDLEVIDLIGLPMTELRERVARSA